MGVWTCCFLSNPVDYIKTLLLFVTWDTPMSQIGGTKPMMNWSSPCDGIQNAEKDSRGSSPAKVGVQSRVKVEKKWLDLDEDNEVEIEDDEDVYVKSDDGRWERFFSFHFGGESKVEAVKVKTETPDASPSKSTATTSVEVKVDSSLSTALVVSQQEEGEDDGTTGWGLSWSTITAHLPTKPKTAEKPIRALVPYPDPNRSARGGVKIKEEKLALASLSVTFMNRVKNLVEKMETDKDKEAVLSVMRLMEKDGKVHFAAARDLLEQSAEF
jgi:hypothetical protein